MKDCGICGKKIWFFQETKWLPSYGLVHRHCGEDTLAVLRAFKVFDDEAVKKQGKPRSL